VSVEVSGRMRDVLLALHFASQNEATISRIRLQKFVYLLDCVSRLYDTLPSSVSHRTYLNGPYDPTIQNAVDVLAFRGFVASEFRKPRSFTYRLASAGSDVVRTWLQTDAFHGRATAARDLAAALEQVGWVSIVKLVYAEPTYRSRSAIGFGQPLVVDDIAIDSARSMCAAISDALGVGAVAELSPATLVYAFLRVLKIVSEKRSVPEGDYDA
jgi:hypothetical protein